MEKLNSKICNNGIILLFGFSKLLKYQGDENRLGKDITLLNIVRLSEKNFHWWNFRSYFSQ